MCASFWQVTAAKKVRSRGVLVCSRATLPALVPFVPKSTSLRRSSLHGMALLPPFVVFLQRQSTHPSTQPVCYSPVVPQVLVSWGEHVRCGNANLG